MLILHQSNRLELLAEFVAEVHARNNSDPFIPEQVVVQNAGMGRWLSRKLADKLGIAANLEFSFPAQLMWSLLGKVLNGLPETAPFDRGPLAWHILAELESAEPGRYPELDQYLKSMNSSGRFQLARQLENLFDHYLFYRPDWIESWQAGKDSHWQARLWRRLRDQSGARHWVDLQQDYVNKLTEQAGQLPQRILFFGIADLSPGYLRLMSETARHIDVHFFVINPAQAHWQDIVSEKRKLSADAAEVEYLEVGNPLLASMGQQGRDFFEQMLELEADDNDARFQAPVADTLLAGIQRDILDVRERIGSPDQREPDGSITVQSCHSVMREVEVLHDQLLAMFQEQPDLRAEDVVVMTPTISDYTPAIEAVFGAAPHKIPWSVADQNLLESTTTGRLLQALLDMPNSRYEVSRVLDLLDIPAVRQRIGLDEEALERIRGWSAELNIRWGIDSRMRAEMDLPETDEHSWRLGLRRLMLGYMLDRDTLFNGVLPYREVEGSIAVDMGRFVEFVESLFGLYAWKDLRDSIAGWMQRFLATFDLLLDDSEASELNELRGALLLKAKQAEQADYTQPIDFMLARKLALDALRGTPVHGGFLSGGITFCELIPMRSVPFRVVCLIGMNFGHFPRPQRQISFDLTAGRYRRGDRSPRLEDRYLFLESLLAAREKLYISYIGQDQRENKEIPPSVLVSELLDYIQAGFGITSAQLIQHQPLQAFSRRYLSSSGFFTYADYGLQSAQQSEESPFFEAPVVIDTDEEELRVDELERFIRRPVLYFLQQTLGIARDWMEAELQEREPFVIEKFVDRDVRQRLHEWMDEPGSLEPYLRQQGLLPHGESGSKALQAQAVQLERLLQRVPELEFMQPQEMDISLSGKRIRGQIDRLTEQGQLWVSYDKPHKYDVLTFWLRHLFWTVDSGASTTSRLIYPEGEIAIQPVANASEQLGQIVETWHEGQRRPVHFMPKSAYEYVRVHRSARSTKSPMQAAREYWVSGEWPEANNDEYRIGFRGVDPFDEEFERLAELIWGGFMDAGGRVP